MTGHHRKHGIRLLGQSSDDGEQQPAVKKGRRIYDEAVRQALIVVWEAADRICGKRLQAALPHLVESMERHGHLDLDPGVRQRLLAASVATLDRLLQPIRTPAGRRLRRRRHHSPGRNIPVRTFAERWHCWADCKRPNRIVSAGLTCVRCSAGCSSGAASWPKSWSTPRLASPWRDPLQCRN